MRRRRPRLRPGLHARVRRLGARAGAAMAAGLVLAACSHPPPPKPPAPEQPAATVADLAGTWVASGELDWGYKMIITPPETIDVWIDRGTMGRCEQKGTLAPRADHVFRIVYTYGECNRQAVGSPLDLQIASFTGDRLTIVMGDQHRTYQRAPGQAAAPEARGAVLR